MGRTFVFCVSALLVLPLLATLLGQAPRMTAENRTLASAPEFPRTWSAMNAFPSRADAWAKDHFGLRGLLVRGDNFLLWRVFGEMRSSRIIIGRHGRLFLSNHDGEPENSLILGPCGVGISDRQVAKSASSARNLLLGLKQAGFLPTLLIVPTAARLNPQDLPPLLARQCAAARPAADRLAASLDANDVVYPLHQLQSLQQAGIAPIPRHHFHWAGEAPLRIAELVAERHWNVPRTVRLPLETISRQSDLNSINPGIALSDRISEPQVKEIGATGCSVSHCAVEAGLSAEAALPLEHYKRPGPGPSLLIVGDSFSDEIARDFLEQFSDVWLLHTNIEAAMATSDRARLAAWTKLSFKGVHMLLVYHDLAAINGLNGIAAVLRVTPKHRGD